MKKQRIQTLLVLLLIPSSFANFDGIPSNMVTATPIKQVIVIMQENHSFDNYFGTYPTANGTLTNEITSKLQPVDGLPNGICLPVGATCIPPHLSASGDSINPIEGQVIYEQDYAAGKMTGFAEFSGPQSMTYFDYHQLAAYWDYAEEYGLADRYFASALTTTTPNRLLLLAGDTPVSHNYGPPPYVEYNQTILGQLEAYGISWGYFEIVAPFGAPNNVYPLNYVSDLKTNGIGHVEDNSIFLRYLSTGAGLPPVSFVNSLGSDSLNEHPNQNVTEGELWAVSMVNAVMSSAYWQSSVIFINWDEGGGYYDHVPPPQVLSINHGFDHPLMGYGQRVPLLVISPYSKQNYVSETVLNHMSILRFIEYNWDLPALNQYVMNSNNLLDFFDFTAPPRLPLILGDGGQYSASLYPIPPQTPPTAFNASNIVTKSPNYDSVILFEAVLLLAVGTVIVLYAYARRKVTGLSRKPQSSSNC